MNNRGTLRNQTLLILLAVALVLVALHSGVMSTQAVDNDGRLNVVYHLGGDVIYCVDADRNPAAGYADGGLLLMSLTGQHLMFVPEAAIESVPELPDVNTVIAEGTGSYGAVTLWRLSNGSFALTGLDEHGNAYDFQWTGCLPVGQSGIAQQPGTLVNPVPTVTALPPIETEEPS